MLFVCISAPCAVSVFAAFEQKGSEASKTHRLCSLFGRLVSVAWSCKHGSKFPMLGGEVPVDLHAHGLMIPPLA